MLVPITTQISGRTPIFTPGGRLRWTPIPGKLRWHYQFVLDRAIGTNPYVRHPGGKVLEFMIY